MVKYLLVVIVFVVISGGCRNAHQGESFHATPSGNPSDTSNLPVIEFIETEHHFGRVYEGEQVGWFFRFKNTGSGDLIIINTSSSCGCTVADYSKSPIRPGKEGEVKVVFDSNGRSGMQSKSIAIETNARNNPVTLTVSAEIIRK